MNKKYFLQAFKITLPVLFGYLAIGIAFGLVLIEKNYPWWLAPIMSIVIFAGAGQFMAIPLFAANAPISAILIAELLLNIRHIVYGLSLITKFNQCGKYKYYLIFALSDETYSLLTTTDFPEGADKGKFYFTIAALDQFYWVIGGIIGTLIGSVIPFSLSGVDFALTSLFVVLFIDQIQKLADGWKKKRLIQSEQAATPDVQIENVTPNVQTSENNGGGEL